MEGERGLESIQSVIDLAKLDTKDLMPVSQAMYFDRQLLDKSSFRILEVPMELAETLCIGGVLILRGEGDDSAVLCSDTTTYDTKEAETSNGLVLLDKMACAEECGKDGVIFKSCREDAYDENRRVHMVPIKNAFSSYLELTPCPPKKFKIRTILRQSKAQYRGADSTWDPEVGVGLAELQDKVQCSTAELTKALKDLQVIRVSNKNDTMLQYDGERIFMLGNDIKMQFLTDLTSFIKEMVIHKEMSSTYSSLDPWENSNIDRSSCTRICSSMDKPRYIFEQIFDYFFIPNEFSCSMDGDKCISTVGYQICKDKVKRFYGECMLPEDSEHKYVYDVDEFCSQWQRSIDLDFCSDLEGSSFDVVNPEKDLKGIVLVDRKERKIEWFPEWKLPLGILERFQSLYSHRARWTLQEITPFVERLATPKLNVNSLITKHSRVISERDGTKLFCSKIDKTGRR